MFTVKLIKMNFKISIYIFIYLLFLALCSNTRGVHGSVLGDGNQFSMSGRMKRETNMREYIEHLTDAVDILTKSIAEIQRQNEIERNRSESIINSIKMLQQEFITSNANLEERLKTESKATQLQIKKLMTSNEDIEQLLSVESKKVSQLEIKDDAQELKIREISTEAQNCEKKISAGLQSISEIKEENVKQFTNINSKISTLNATSNFEKETRINYFKILELEIKEQGSSIGALLNQTQKGTIRFDLLSAQLQNLTAISNGTKGSISSLEINLNALKHSQSNMEEKLLALYVGKHPNSSEIPDFMLPYLLKPSMKVVRGSDWKWDNQDGGKGKIGTVGGNITNGWVEVKWTNGNKNNYRVGHDGKFDIKFAPSNTTDNFFTHKLHLYSFANYLGLTEIIDFTSCRLTDTCCRNLLGNLDQEARSINTSSGCVVAYLEKNCNGDSRRYVPGIHNHYDLEDYNDKIRSVKPCML